MNRVKKQKKINIRGRRIREIIGGGWGVEAREASSFSKARPRVFPGSCPKHHLSWGFTHKCRCPAKLFWAQPLGQERRIKTPELKAIRLQKRALNRLE